MGRTCSDHRQPGSSTSRPTTISPILTVGSAMRVTAVKIWAGPFNERTSEPSGSSRTCVPPWLAETAQPARAAESVTYQQTDWVAVAGRGR
jgi:hypothetical protein